MGQVMAALRHLNQANLYRVGYNCIVEVHESYAENTGKILCTDLFNYAMPFIRYELGDEIRLAPSSEDDGYNVNN